MLNRRLLYCLLPVFVLLSVPVSAIDPDSDHSIEGVWKGTMEVYGEEFPLTLIFTESTGQLLSPKHSQVPVPLSRIVLDDRDLSFQSEFLRGSFSGKLSPGSGKIRGDWTQDGHVSEFDLKLDEQGVAVDRPQNPRGDPPYEVREVSFPNQFGPHQMSGTLTLPEGAMARVPAVVLVSGMGPQDRDATAFGHKPFWVLADFLTRKGIAVLRFDDRGTGKSGGNFEHAHTLDFATDARAAVECLKGMKEINPERIGLLGQGEGAWVALLAATKRDDVAFLVLLGAPGVSGDRMILNQAARIGEVAGLSKEFQTLNEQFHTALFEVLSQPVPNLEKVTELGKKFEIEMGKLGKSGDAGWEGLEETMLYPLTRLEDPWLPWVIRHDPGESLQKMELPMLVLTGELDLQMCPQVHFPAIRKQLRGKEAFVEIDTIPGVNHYFQRAGTGAPSEYGSIEETISPRVLKRVGDWIEKTAER